MKREPFPDPLPARTVDLNADVGEGFGRYRLDDSGLWDGISSASIACGFHAGDPIVMRETVATAVKHGVTVGAHPGYPDLTGFGRRELTASPDEVEAMVIYQVGALQAFCIAAGTRLRYVKPHGSLYNRAARDVATAEAIARAVHAVDPALALLGLAGSAMISAAATIGLRGVTEAFVDRAYRTDGTLVPRTESGAVLTDVTAIADRAVSIIKNQTVQTIDGTVIAMAAESMCTHGDGPDAIVIVQAVRAALERAGVTVAPFMHD